MRRTTAIGLVAQREIVERGRTRGYLFSLLATSLLLVAGLLLPSLLPGLVDSGSRLAVVGTPAPGLDAALAAVAKAYDVKLALSSQPDRAAAEAALDAKTIDAALEVPPDLSGPGTLTFRERSDGALQAVVNATVVQLRAGSAAAPPAVAILRPPAESEVTAILFANLGVILMFIGIMAYGSWVLTGVVEEKQSRVVEVVLSTVRPRDLLMGKVLGIGILAIIQLAVLVAVAVGASQVSGQLPLPPTTLPAIAQLLTWFVLGFAFYSTAMGALGALASRTEDASSAAMPVSMVAVFCYMVSLTVVQQDPDGLLGRVLTFLPPAAPMVVPLRVALGAIEPWEVAGSIALMVAAIWLLFEVGARVYAGAALQTGSRMKLREAWRARR